MIQLLRMGAILAAALALSGCLAMSTDHPYPVTDNSPNPAPVRGYRVQCQSEPGAFNFLFHEFVTACQQIIGPSRDVVVVRAKG